MSFFKQTKETRRKISFWLVLAMVISLLPVSPMVKAEDNTNTGNTATATGNTVTATLGSIAVKVTVNDATDNKANSIASITLKLNKKDANATTSATITLTSEKFFHLCG